jgi:hypothetical protein
MSVQNKDIKKRKRPIQYYLSDYFRQHFLRILMSQIISFSSNSKKISRSINITRQSSKILSRILFLHSLQEKKVAQRMFAIKVDRASPRGALAGLQSCGGCRLQRLHRVGRGPGKAVEQPHATSPLAAAPFSVQSFSCIFFYKFF